MLGVKKRNDRKTWNSRSIEKVVGFSSASLFHIGKCEVVTPGWNFGTREIDNLM